MCIDSQITVRASRKKKTGRGKGNKAERKWRSKVEYIGTNCLCLLSIVILNFTRKTSFDKSNLNSIKTSDITVFLQPHL